MNVPQLLDLLPRGLYEGDTDAQRALEGLLAPIGRIDDLLDARARELPQLLDAATLPDDLIRHLAAQVGLGPGLAATASATPAELRRLIPTAVALWELQGTRSSVRALVASLTGSRSIAIEWLDFRTVHGSSGRVTVIPGPSVAGGYYGTPQNVVDLWYQDPAGTVDPRPLVRLLALVRPAGERINLARAWLVDDLGIGASLWRTVEPSAGAWSYDPDRWELHALDGHGFTTALDALPATWADYHASVRLAVTGSAWLRILDGGNDDHYAVYVDQPTGEISLLRNLGGATAALAVHLGRPLKAAHPYLWALEAWDGASGLTIRVYREGAKVIDVVDSTPGRPSAGGLAWGSGGAGDLATLSSALVRPRGSTPTRIGPPL